jgi:hypothetical protein
MKTQITELLKNPEIRRRVRQKVRDVQGTTLAAGNSMLSGLPSHNESFRQALKKYKKESPVTAQRAKIAGKILGEAGTAFVPGGVAIKGLKTITKLRPILAGKGLGSHVLKGAIYGGASRGATSAINRSDETTANVGQGAIEGAVIGAGLGNAGRVAKALKHMIKPQSKFADARKVIENVGYDLARSMTKKDMMAAKKIVASPLNSKYLNLDTLLHRGNPHTDAIIDALYQKSPEVRGIIELQRKRLSAGQLPHIKEAIIKAGNLKGAPSTEKLVEAITRQQSKTAEPLYEKAFKQGKIVLPERSMKDPALTAAIKEVRAKLNKLDLGKKGYEDTSIRVLHDAKQNIDDQISALTIKGKRNASRKLSQLRNDLKEKLDEASPHYRKATELTKKYFDAADAAKAGLEFKTPTLEEMTISVDKMSPMERHAHKVGALETLSKEAEKIAQNTQLGQAGRKIDNAEILRKLEKIIGKDKAENLMKDVEITNEAARKLNTMTRGSETEKHVSNKGILLSALAASRGSARGIVNLGYRIAGKLQGKAGRHGNKTRINMLLNPKRLLKYEHKRPPAHMYGTPQGTAAIVEEINEE